MDSGRSFLSEEAGEGEKEEGEGEKEEGEGEGEERVVGEMDESKPAVEGEMGESAGTGEGGSKVDTKEATSSIPLYLDGRG